MNAVDVALLSICLLATGFPIISMLMVIEHRRHRKKMRELEREHQELIKRILAPSSPKHTPRDLDPPARPE